MGKLLKDLEIMTGLPQLRFITYSASASDRYKVYTIPKASGGVRVIHHPARFLKGLQRWLASYLLSRASVSSQATAYKKGASTVRNALPHASQRYTLHLDFHDFFPSFLDVHVRQLVERLESELQIGLDSKDVEFCVAICCRHGRLTIGAPTSPVLTNAILADFDTAIDSESRRSEVVYTRYADDIYLSGNSKAALHVIEQSMDGHVRRSGVPLRFNESKRRISGRGSHRRITGLVVTPNGDLSLGRDRVRLLRAMCHRASLGQLEPSKLRELQGWLSYCSSVSPSVAVRLSRVLNGTDA